MYTRPRLSRLLHDSVTFWAPQSYNPGHLSDHLFCPGFPFCFVKVSPSFLDGFVGIRGGFTGFEGFSLGFDDEEAFLSLIVRSPYYFTRYMAMMNAAIDSAIEAQKQMIDAMVSFTRLSLSLHFASCASCRSW